MYLCTHPLVLLLLLLKLLLLLLLKVVVAGGGGGGLERAVRIHYEAHVAHHGRQPRNRAVRAVRS